MTGQKYARPIATEKQIQKAVFDHLRVRGVPGIFAFHPRNEGTDMKQWNVRGFYAGLGVVSGVPDVIIIKNGQCYALELKRAGGSLTRTQMGTMARMREAGAVCEVAYGLDEALYQLGRWGILHGPWF